MIHIAKSGDVAIVQVPASWSQKQVRAEQGRVNRNIAKTGAPVHVVIVSGGEVSVGQVIDDVIEGAETALAAAE